jgi:serine/threonine-protein kinase
VQLQASVSEQFDEAVPAGTVLSAGVPAGTQLDRGTAVPLVVSKGPAPVPVPNVVGQPGTSAAAALQASGFAVSGIEGSPSGAVLATDPPAGELHQRGTAVRIFTRS